MRRPLRRSASGRRSGSTSPDRGAVTAAGRAAGTFGHLDIVVNNAGYGLFGMVEETTEEQARAQLDTDLLGPLWVTQAALPFLRARRGGHFIQVSSIGGVAAFPALGLYNASKWALEGMSVALAQEVRPFGIHVTIIEPGPYGTDWSGASAVHTEPIAAYEPVREARRGEARRRHRPRATGPGGHRRRHPRTRRHRRTATPALPRHLPPSRRRSGLPAAARHLERLAPAGRQGVTDTA
ncbi:SDR family NAD(P)-dependent oxidoreductase [Streptomyces sp. NPDC088194]|uniref:SDR family NAD(P)-dependent oxidoreductase n=1 Tax=Streptomyces sp. NPDC088194 TaxID=3154931 RepID=UPI0034502DEB